MSVERLQIRCTKRRSPGAELADHLALDVHLPLAVDALDALSVIFKCCPCGEPLVVSARDEEAGRG